MHLSEPWSGQLELESKICELETLLENSVPLEDVEKREQDLKDQIASLEEDLAFDDLTDIQAAIHEKMRQLEAEISASRCGSPHPPSIVVCALLRLRVRGTPLFLGWRDTYQGSQL